ncbi:MAG: prepilin-type N-terminal cleavage/methylation domain-containing protein [Myxococcales bacterium]|nr:prepilin-type N-terminal cleavage/methylation domain-containing protein [Myxococcales bacterium]
MTISSMFPTEIASQSNVLAKPKVITRPQRPATHRFTPAYRRVSRGLTLIEIVIAVGLVGLIAGGALVSIQALSHSRLRSATFALAGAIKESYDRAIMEKRTQRLTFDLNNHVWWAEFTEDPYALSNPDIAEEEARLQINLDDETPADIRKALLGQKAAAFAPDPYMGGKNKLPADIHFGRAWTGTSEDAFTKGLVYIHFFRGGFTEPFQLEIYDGPLNGNRQDREWMTIKVRPLTGRVRVYSEQLDAPDERRPWEEDD